MCIPFNYNTILIVIEKQIIFAILFRILQRARTLMSSGVEDGASENYDDEEWEEMFPSI